MLSFGSEKTVFFQSKSFFWRQIITFISHDPLFQCEYNWVRNNQSSQYPDFVLSKVRGAGVCDEHIFSPYEELKLMINPNRTTCLCIVNTSRVWCSAFLRHPGIQGFKIMICEVVVMCVCFEAADEMSSCITLCKPSSAWHWSNVWRRYHKVTARVAHDVKRWNFAVCDRNVFSPSFETGRR